MGNITRKLIILSISGRPVNIWIILIMKTKKILAPTQTYWIILISNLECLIPVNSNLRNILQKMKALFRHSSRLFQKKNWQIQALIFKARIQQIIYLLLSGTQVHQTLTLVITSRISLPVSVTTQRFWGRGVPKIERFLNLFAILPKIKGCLNIIKKQLHTIKNSFQRYFRIIFKKKIIKVKLNNWANMIIKY